MRQSLRINQYIFQSTLSVRRATQGFRCYHHWRTISIHALREESDLNGIEFTNCTMSFQSTLSVRRATCNLRHDMWIICISIHALREESDRKSARRRHGHRHFNPRSP